MKRKSILLRKKKREKKIGEKKHFHQKTNEQTPINKNPLGNILLKNKKTLPIVLNVAEKKKGRNIII